MTYTKMNKASRKQVGSRWFIAFNIFVASSLLGTVDDASAQSINGRDQAIQHLRQVLEQPYLEQGGFSAFDCSLTSGNRPRHAFTCTAMLSLASMAGKEIEYLLVPDPELGFKVDMVTQSASQTFEEGLPAMDKACRQFIQQFNQADWAAMYAGFDPNLQKIVSEAAVGSSLSPIRDLLGVLGEPELELYSYRGTSGRDELQYKIPAKNALAAFRCGLNSAGTSVTVLAYLIAPHVESSIYKTNLESEVAIQLSEFYEMPISRVEIPLEQLSNMYDVADGIGTLENGERIKIKITRSGRLDDFSPKDYTFALYESQD